MRNPILLFICIGQLLFSACSSEWSKRKVALSTNPQVSAQQSEKYYYQALHSSNNLEKKEWAQIAAIHARACLKKQKDNKACLYYQALSLGLFYQINLVGYQKGLRLMVQNLKQLDSLDPHFAHAGAARILGQIYLKAPALGDPKKDVVRNHKLALHYALKSIQNAPDYALNHLFAAEVLIKNKQKAEARASLAKFDKLVSSQLADRDFPKWKRLRSKLGSKLKSKPDFKIDS